MHSQKGGWCRVGTRVRKTLTERAAPQPEREGYYRVQRTLPSWTITMSLLSCSEVDADGSAQTQNMH
eukprot:scaffold523_cov166-Amphora_coffeaeformis.AAC.3